MHRVAFAMLCCIAGCGDASESGLFDGTGTAASGGTTPTDASAGASNGGAAGSGAAPSTGGGVTPAGGDATAGGASGSGGAPVTGGMSGAGGATATGGASATGGVAATGGVTFTGGAGGSAVLDGGIPPGPSPGIIACGGTPCGIAGTPTNVCCVSPPPFPVACYPSFPGCITGGAVVACDDAVDCAPGDVCCANRDNGTAACAPSCTQAAEIQLCRSQEECVTGACMPLPELPDYDACQ